MRGRFTHVIGHLLAPLASFYKEIVMNKTLLALTCLLTALSASAAGKPNPSTPLRVGKPNIVHILTDDLGWQDVAAYYRAVHGKESIYETPHMDRIAENGLRFMQAYSPSATCAPSRAAYMAGQYTPHTGVLHVMGSMPPRPHNRGSVTILSLIHI